MSVKCIFCGEAVKSKAARKRHNKTCTANVNREKAQAETRGYVEKYKDTGGKRPRYHGASEGRMDPELFTDLFDDLPDGAFFAMAEQHGLEPTDFV